MFFMSFKVKFMDFDEILDVFVKNIAKCEEKN